METLDAIQYIDISNISKAFGLENNSFLILIIGSFIVGYICLTFYYKIYYDQDNEKWTKLDFSEKAIISLIIGFLSIMNSLFFVAIWQLSYMNDKNLEQFFSQLNYVVPFIYFTAISVFFNRKDNFFKGLDFIKKYISYSVTLIMNLSFIFIFIILYLNRNWYGILLIFLFVILIYRKNIVNFFKRYVGGNGL